jgi:MFS family permease
MCGGISMTMSRSIVQEAAPASHRARVMSVFQLGMMGGMPIGSVVLGWCVGEYGARNAVLVPVVGMACMVVVIALTSSLWSVRRDAPAPVGG